MKANFKIMKEGESETYLGDIIGKKVTENETFSSPMDTIESLANKWLKEHIGILGRTIVANTLLSAKLSHRARIKRISKV